MGGNNSSPSYDSTWEEDEHDTQEKPVFTHGSQEQLISQKQEAARKRQNGKPTKFTYKYMSSEAARDMQNYRRKYRHSDPAHRIYPKVMPNLYFYQNKMPYQPDGLCIEELLQDWKENYDELEQNHSYIQWLFPLREPGKNQHAAPLHEAEIEEMRKDSDVTRRFLEAYKLMLRFYGLRLQDEGTGEVARAVNWEERYCNLNNHSHNNLRITRILKSLGELGYQHYQAPLVKLFLEETLLNGTLQSIKRSVLDYFIFSVRDKEERRDLLRFAWQHYQPKDGFIWGPEELLQNGHRAAPVEASIIDQNTTTDGEPCTVWCCCCCC